MKLFADINGDFSWKRFLFVLSSFIALLSPIVLICLDKISGRDFIEYYRVTIMGFLINYAYGKKVDGDIQSAQNIPKSEG